MSPKTIPTAATVSANVPCFFVESDPEMFIWRDQQCPLARPRSRLLPYRLPLVPRKNSTMQKDASVMIGKLIGGRSYRW